jgi:hypothetical protein
VPNGKVDLKTLSPEGKLVGKVDHSQIHEKW